MKNILIIKTGALGDVLRTTVILEGLVEKYVNPNIFWITSEAAKPLLENNPFIEKIYYQENLDKDIFKRKYDFVISLEEDKKLLDIVEKLDFKMLFGVYKENDTFKYTPRSSMWYDLSLISRFGKEIADKLKLSNIFSYPELMYRILDLNWSKQRYRLFLIKRDIKYANELKKKIDLSKPLIGIAVGAGKRWPMKSLTKDQQIKLIKKIRKKYKDSVNIILLTGPDQFELSKTEGIKEECPYVIRHKVQNLEQFTGVINLCNLIISPDSLAAHIGIALTKYVVVYFTVTSAEEIEVYTGSKIIAKHKDYCTYTTEDKSRPNITDKINLDEIVRKVELVLK